ncbi:MAG: hypothetical protein ABW085_12010 [Sedimenticola sp.]
MIKRLIAALRSRGSGLPPVESLVGKEDDICHARRGFFKRAAVGAISVTGTAGVAKGVVDSMPKPDLKQKYDQDARSGEDELQNWEYVQMSEEEKSDMIKSFTDSYADRA